MPSPVDAIQWKCSNRSRASGSMTPAVLIASGITGRAVENIKLATSNKSFFYWISLFDFISNRSHYYFIPTITQVVS